MGLRQSLFSFSEAQALRTKASGKNRLDAPPPEETKSDVCKPQTTALSAGGRASNGPAASTARATSLPAARPRPSPSPQRLSFKTPTSSWGPFLNSRFECHIEARTRCSLHHPRQLPADGPLVPWMLHLDLGF